MSQRINVRDARQGSGAFIAVIVLVLLVGAGLFVYFMWFNKVPLKDVGPLQRTPSQEAVNLYSSFKETLTDIATDPETVDEELKSLKKIDTDLDTLIAEYPKANAEEKAKIAEANRKEMPGVIEAWDKALATSGVKDQLEPVGKPIYDKLSGLGK